MLHHRNKPRGVILAGLLTLAGCSAAPADPTAATTTTVAAGTRLGLMTSLPLYWPEGAEVTDLAAGREQIPWQRRLIETRYTLVPLDTLSPIPALSPDTPDTDPLAGIARLAVIQPRGLSPADNVALDAWVRRGGRLLLVLDPALTGEYTVPLGDPRRPVDAALIPPVAARWGLSVSFDESQAPAVTTTILAGAVLPLALAGQIAITNPAAAAAAAACTVLAEGAAATCRVGAGRVTVIADAALFEHPALVGEGGARLLAALVAALE